MRCRWPDNKKIVFFFGFPIPFSGITPGAMNRKLCFILNNIFPGHTHDGSFNLFSIGGVTSSGLKMFVETGQTNGLELESTNGAFDFVAPAILSGRGYSEANIFVDADHSLVSFATKVTPSPDWFVGVDSLKVSWTLLKIIHWQCNSLNRFTAVRERFLGGK